MTELESGPDTSGAYTASQTVGPYLSIGLLREVVTPNVVDPGDPGAIAVGGVLLDGAGDPVPDGMVESWQADPSGSYPDGRAAFRGLGRSGTVDEGRWEIVTVKPGPVPWPGGGLQAPHLVLFVFARGLLKHLVTRMYFPDEVDANAADPVLTQLDERQRDSLIAEAEGGGLRFDIVLQGPLQTTFFAV
jgi:protocatechuate 3,4-dioxygenase alpha subunit